MRALACCTRDGRLEDVPVCDVSLIFSFWMAAEKSAMTMAANTNGVESAQCATMN